MKPVVLHRQALADAARAVEYLNDSRDGLGDEFRDELEAAIRLIRKRPKAFSPYPGGYRKHLMAGRFPYQIFYVEYDDHVWVAAVHHAHREPDTWMGRNPE